MIQGITITLLNKVQTGTDGFGRPIYEYVTGETVDNVLVGEPTPQEYADELNLTGKAIRFIMGIPKGDTHDWTDQVVEFFGHKFRTFGIPAEGIEANIPLAWNKKVKCERYE